MVDEMMYVQSLKLLDALHAQRERERSESIEPEDDAAAVAEGAFRTAAFDDPPAAQQYADGLRTNLQAQPRLHRLRSTFHSGLASAFVDVLVERAESRSRS